MAKVMSYEDVSLADHYLFMLPPTIVALLAYKLRQSKKHALFIAVNGYLSCQMVAGTLWFNQDNNLEPKYSTRRVYYASFFYSLPPLYAEFVINQITPDIIDYNIMDTCLLVGGLGAVFCQAIWNGGYTGYCQFKKRKPPSATRNLFTATACGTALGGVVSVLLSMRSKRKRKKSRERGGKLI